MKATEHQRRALRLMLVAGVAAAAIGVGVAVSAGGGSAMPAANGPQVLPLVTAPALAPAAAPAAGQTVDGISCGPTEQLAYHVHVRLSVFVNGTPRSIPARVGIGDCIALLHTHAPDGIVHVESPQAITYVLDQFFAVWGQPLGLHGVGPAKGRVTAFVDGRRYPGDPRTIPLTARSQIQLDVGRPVVPPMLADLPPSL